MESDLIRVRRQLHMYPELGFELPRTLALLRQELDSIGVEYTEQYGKSSIVATVNPEKSRFTIGIRADTDALPITERNDVPYRSKIEGQMHACGHDVHTSIALETLRRVYAMREQIGCRVRFLFQSAEEHTVSGAKKMAEDGVMDEIDCIAALHCDNRFDAGEIGISAGAQGAISHSFSLDFHGKNAHVAYQQNGVDAIMMAVQAYSAIEFMIAKEFPAVTPILFNVGRIQGGTANNVIAGSCKMDCSLRNCTEENDEKATRRIREILQGIAYATGGTAEYLPGKYYPIVYNHAGMTEQVRLSAQKVLGADHILPNPRGMEGEDFSYLAQRKPGCMFRLGIRNAEKGITNGIHTDCFDVDERAMEVGVRVFLKFILDHMNGIAF